MQQVEDLGAGPPLQISVPPAGENKVASEKRVHWPAPSLLPRVLYWPAGGRAERGT